MVIKKCSFWSGVNSGDVDNAVCEYFFYMEPDFCSVNIDIQWDRY
jgi:hypothetical protein